MKRIVVTLACALALPLGAIAGPMIESLKGDVQAGEQLVRAGAKLEVPSAVSTGIGGQAFLKFDDGMQIVLGENSLLRMVDYRYTSSGVTDRAVLHLLRGSARVVTGKVAANNPKQFFFRTPQGQLQVDAPSDFTVVLVNPAYITVNAGSVIASNTAGSFTLSAGSVSTIASNSTAATAIPASALPATAASPMSSLSLAAVSAPAGSASSGVGAALGGAAATSNTLVILGVAAAIAVGVAIVAQDDDSPSPSATTSHH